MRCQNVFHGIIVASEERHPALPLGVVRLRAQVWSIIGGSTGRGGEEKTSAISRRAKVENEHQENLDDGGLDQILGRHDPPELHVL